MTYLAGIAIAFLLWWFIGRHAVSASRSASPQPADSFYSKVVGVTHSNSDGQKRQHIIKAFCKEGAPLELRPEPQNPVDPEAIGIWIGTDQIGYLPAGRTASEVLQMISSGNTVTARVSNVTGGTKDKPTYGVNILISH